MVSPQKITFEVPSEISAGYLETPPYKTVPEQGVNIGMPLTSAVGGEVDVTVHGPPNTRALARYEVNP
jgi:hypothetical protein